MKPITDFRAQALDWRDECLHKRTLYIEVIDRVPVEMLIALIDHAFPPATSGFFMRSDDVPSALNWNKHPAEREWAEVWRRHERRTRSTRPLP